MFSLSFYWLFFIALFWVSVSYLTYIKLKPLKHHKRLGLLLIHNQSFRGYHLKARQFQVKVV